MVQRRGREREGRENKIPLFIWLKGRGSEEINFIYPSHVWFAGGGERLKVNYYYTITGDGGKEAAETLITITSTSVKKIPELELAQREREEA